MEKHYNVFGDELTTKKSEVRKKSFLKSDGSPNWVEPNEVVDADGFDKKNVEPNGQYKMMVELPMGTRLCRYGAKTGYFTAPCGTPFENLGLPWKEETVQYHEYEVIADGTTIKCIVTRGKVAEMFESPGGAIQYMHPHPLEKEVDEGILKEDYSWLKRRKEN